MLGEKGSQKERMSGEEEFGGDLEGTRLSRQGKDRDGE